MKRGLPRGAQQIDSVPPQNLIHTVRLVFERVITVSGVRKIRNPVRAILTGFPHMHAFRDHQRFRSHGSIYGDVLVSLSDRHHDQLVAVPYRVGVEFATVGDRKFRGDLTPFGRSVRRMVLHRQLLRSNEEPIGGFFDSDDAACHLNDTPLEDVGLCLDYAELRRNEIAGRIRKERARESSSRQL